MKSEVTETLGLRQYAPKRLRAWRSSRLRFMETRVHTESKQDVTSTLTRRGESLQQQSQENNTQTLDEK